MHKQWKKGQHLINLKNIIDKPNQLVCLLEIVKQNKSSILLNKKSVHLYIAVRHRDHLVYKFCTSLM